jgi:hypothetical protein
MKFMHHLVRGLALPAFFAGLALSSYAQVGSGWSSWSPTYVTQERGSGDISGNTYRLTSSSGSGEHRAERRYQTTTSGQSQFQGTLKIVSMGGDRISVAQCFKDGDTPNSILAYKKPNILYQVRHGGDSLGTLTIGSTIRVNTTINTSNGYCEIYLNGSRKDRVTEGSGDYYHKLGAYRTASGRGPVTVEWTNIRFWRK